MDIAKEQSDAIDIQLVIPPLTEVEPGKVFTCSALITNHSVTSKALQAHVALPAGWLAISEQTQSLILAPLETQLYIIAVQVPLQTKKDIYSLKLQIQSDDSNICAEANLAVIGKCQVEFKCEEVPALVAAGRSYSFVICGHNSGNEDVSLQLRAQSHSSCRVTYQAGTIALPPGGNLRQEIVVYTDEDAPCSDQCYINIQVIDICSCACLYHYTAITEVLAGSRYKVDEWIYLPNYARFFAVGQEGENAVGVELTGKGSIDETGFGTLDYIFRLPTNSYLNTYDEYQKFYIGVSDPAKGIYLGDTNYTLTPLTEFERYARGIEVDYSFGPWSMGSFYAQDRLRKHSCQLQEAAAYIGYQFEDRGDVALSYLHKHLPANSLQAHLISLQTTFTPDDNIYFTAEIAGDFARRHRNRYTHSISCKQTRHNLQNHSAHHLALRGRYGQDTWYYMERYYAGREFFGYYNATTINSAGIDLPLASHLRANLSTNHQTANHKYPHVQRAAIDCDDCALDSLPRRHQYNGQISYLLAHGSAAITGMLLQARDNSPDSSDHHRFTQTWGGFNVAHYWDSYSFFGSANYGRMHDQRLHHTVASTYKKSGHKYKHLQSYYAYLSWNLFASMQWQLHYEAGNTDLYDASHWHYAIGGSVNYRYDKSSYCDLFLRVVRDNFHGNVNPQQHLHATARLFHTFSNGHTLATRAEAFYTIHQAQRRNTRNQYKYLVSYTVPFEYPWKRRNDSGAIEGVLWDTELQTPIHDAIVSLGSERAFTDECGRYRFAGIKPGVYSLRTAVLPRQQVSAALEPASVPIYGGCTVEYDLPIVTAGCIAGCIKLYAVEESLTAIEQMLLEGHSEHIPLIAKQGLANVCVTIDLNCGEEIHTATTDLLGRFIFTGLRPGSWRVNVHGDLPAKYNLTRVFTVDVRPGQKRELTIKVVPNMHTFAPSN